MKAVDEFSSLTRFITAALQITIVVDGTFVMYLYLLYICVQDINAFVFRILWTVIDMIIADSTD